MKIPRLFGALVVAALVALPAAPVQADSNPTIDSIATQGCANDTVNVTLTVDNPVAGTITLELTGHTPGSSVFVDTGARLTFTIVPGTTTYSGSFENVSSFTAGQGFNTLRVEFASSDIANLGGTITKSVSFAPCASPTTMPPHITKGFGTSSIPFGGSTSLSFTIDNPNASTQLTGVGFTDSLPAGLVVATPSNGLTGSCGGGTITANPDASSVSLTGATLAGGSSCTFSVKVIGISPGPDTNTTSAVTSNEGGPGNMATDSVTVLSCPASQPFGHLLTAHTDAGTILGGFCVNSFGIGTYTQGSVSGTGIVQQHPGTTQIAAFGTNLNLAGNQFGSINSFAESAPTFAIGTFSLS